MHFTSEQVSMGHPDKICDQIADAIVTDYLQHDPQARVAVECMIKGYLVFIAGEITSAYSTDHEQLVRDVLRRIGLPDVDRYTVTQHITKQSGDIARGVDRGGAGDQGMVFGYATDETPEMLPIPFAVATHALQLLRDLNSPLLLPDAKCQVTYDYYNKRITTFLISTQHTKDAGIETLKPLVHSIMEHAADDYGLNNDFMALINPTGSFVCGGSFADTGVTGRKIVADSYGGVCRHGGGAFSGKDPTKIDRSAAYMARKIARDVVRDELAERCEIQIAYAIGLANPISLCVQCYGTNKVAPSHIAKHIRNTYDLTPQGIIRTLDLTNVDYNRVSAYGHFGKEGLPWEQ